MDGSDSCLTDHIRSEDASMRRFALHVVSKLARASAQRSGHPRASLASLVVRFARSGNPALLDMLQAEIAHHRVQPEDVMDIYLPFAVQEIGTEWHEDRLDSLQASMAFARLQGLLRELGRSWISDQVGGSSGRVLLMLPSCERHTLGAMFAANQLRRYGVSVKVTLAPADAELARVLRNGSFHGVFLSVSNITSLEPCRDIIRVIRKATRGRIPVVLGGGLVSQGIDDNDPQRIVAVTGADLVSNNIQQALHFCGIHQANLAAE
ncbi:MAG: cobalamin-dependent protein [Roseinatronobacter sp.]